MEKRFVTFLIFAFAILMAHSMVVQMLWPPAPVADEQLAERDGEGPPPDEAQRQEAATPPGEEGADQSGDVPAGAAAAAAAAVKGSPTAELPRGAEGADPKPPPAKEAEAAPPRQEQPERWVTLGSLDPADGYRMLVVLTSRGAAIERLALASPRYTSLEDRNGYLGPLALEDLPGGKGCRVRVVGPGTPVAKAGLVAGDIITAIGCAGAAPIPVGTAEELRLELEKTRPKQEATLTVERDGKPTVDLSVTLRRRPLEVMRPERENLLDRLRERDEPPPPEMRDPHSLLVTASQIGTAEIAADETELPDIHLHDGTWEIVSHDARSVTFRRTIAGSQLEFIKRYRLDKVPSESLDDPTFPGYGLVFDIEIRNRGETPQQVAYRLDGPTGLPVEGWWYANKIGRGWGGVGLRDMVVRFLDADPQLIGCAAIVKEDVGRMDQNRSLMFAGIDAQYFSAVLIPHKEQLSDVWFANTEAVRVAPKPESEDKENVRLVNVTCRLTSKTVELQPGGPPLRHQYTLFAGPKVPGLLASYGQQKEMRVYNLKDLVYYGWFGWVAKPMLGILHAFYSIVGNYGIAIIILTVLVRGCMFPLSLKQTRNMKKMQELQPEIKRIAEKYKSDMEKRTKAQQDLFRAHNYNPMGGCLVMFIQLPIFLGLYRSLMVDVELRQAPLLGDTIRWCSNLAAPDMLWDWSAVMPGFMDFIIKGEGIFGLGPYLNILPIATIGLFIAQQKMFMPPPADEQAAMQQNIMKYMMVFMGVLFFKVASGLCLYFIASSLWGLAERKLLPKTTPVGGSSAQAAPPPPERPSGNGSSPRPSKKRRPKQKPRRR